jgi:hypothetical protein
MSNSLPPQPTPTSEFTPTLAVPRVQQTPALNAENGRPFARSCWRSGKSCAKSWRTTKRCMPLAQRRFST